jgi:hypothetical protein
VTVSRIDVGVAVEEARYERDAATGVRGEWVTVGVGEAAVVVACHCACGRVSGCAVRFKPAGSGMPTTAAKASGHLFNVCRQADTGKWYAHIVLRGVHLHTRHHKHAWQAAADLEWQLARWCAHTGQPRSRYVSNAARLIELGRADAAGVLTEAVEVTPWDLSRWHGSSAPAVAPVAPVPRGVSARAAASRGASVSAPSAAAPRRMSARAATTGSARAIAPAPAVGVGGPAAAAVEEPQPDITVELEHLTREEQRLVAPWLTDDLLDAMACRREDEPPSPEVAVYVAILRAERAMREAEQAVAAAAAGGGGGGAGDAAPVEEAPADVAVVAAAAGGAGSGGWGGAIDLAIADAAAAEASGGAWQDAWEALRNAPAVVVPPEPSLAPAPAAAAVGSKRRRGSGAESSQVAAARASAGGRRRMEEGGGGGSGR